MRMRLLSNWSVPYSRSALRLQGDGVDGALLRPLTETEEGEKLSWSGDGPLPARPLALLFILYRMTFLQYLSSLMWQSLFCE